ncbi:MAG: hypothetical protein RLZZ450_6609 [Pseudomonadota bacterium]|jgi:hypothetical protein
MTDLRALALFFRSLAEAPRASTLGSLALVAAATGCHYDLDSIYEHVVADAGSVVVVDAGTTLHSDQLIASWIGHHPSVTEDCVSCAETSCADVNTTCKADASCAAYTACVGKDPTPAGQAACRATFASWVSQPDTAKDRDLTGPYGQCVFRYKCSAQCAANNDLFCVNDYTWPLTSQTSVPLHLFLVDAFEQTKRLPNMRVRVCAVTDFKCNAPAAETTTDANGLAELNLPGSFSNAFTGYFEVTGPDIYPTLLKFSWNVATETTQLVGIVREAQFKQAIEAIELKPDDTRGMLQIRMLGCGNLGVSGASFSSNSADQQTRNWYIIGALPMVGANATDTVGSGGIIDVPEGSTTITATRASDGVAIARSVVPVRAKYMSVVILNPLAK